MRHQTLTRRFLFLCCIALAVLGLSGQADTEAEPHVAELIVDGAIGPATTDYLTRSMERAHAQGAQAIIIRMDTPGGLDVSTRDIIKAILAAPIPVITYVHPSGGRAASAGTYILYGSHVAAMAPSTSMGAATPVQMGGAPVPGADDDRDNNERANNEEDADQEEREEEDAEPRAPTGDAMERKMVNDAVAFIRGLAERHGRNADWAERAVREGISATASEALELNVIDVVAKDQKDLLAQVHGMEVVMDFGPLTLETEDLPIVEYAPDWRNEFLSLITNPQIASILLLIGIYGLILEGYNPGAMVPGVVGVICLLIGLYALQVLPVNYVGVALIVLGAIMIISEMFVPSFGVLGIGGVIALVLGSIMLVDTDVPGMEVSYEIVGAIAAVGGIAVLFIATMLGRSLRMPRLASDQAMVGRAGHIVQITEEGYKVSIDGEFWNAVGDGSLNEGETVEVVGQDGLILTVRRA
ncbi:nodulation protein NfeD [Marinimicrobium sp. ABcell2]|uniref:NfeD family protein n=1 Tax=Marinimicrobium sp. ABcell2 TaxID=3069751 RepID=UPI0027AF4490|nr:nodulation protein NfeD [Marinimicrobium sp. ABcell2]MDQ2076624.1 nodulation protein NfeD [Marinimicrobium sp. ABcell2]